MASYHILEGLRVQKKILVPFEYYLLNIFVCEGRQAGALGVG